MGVGVQDLVIAAVLVGGLVVVVPLMTSTLDYSIVLTASMEPAIGVGDVVAIREAEPEEIEVGDVMAFHAPGKSTNKPVIHRVVEINRDDDGELEFRTKGDNLEEKDPWTVKEEHVVGKVAYQIPKIGWFINLLRGGSSAFYLLMIVGPAAALVYDQVQVLLGDDDEPDEPEDTGPSWIEPYAQRIVDEHSNVEDGIEQSMAAWMASQFVEEPYGPFRVVDDGSRRRTSR